MGLENRKRPAQLFLGRPRKKKAEIREIINQESQAHQREASRIEEEVPADAEEWQVDIAQSDSSFERGLQTLEVTQNITGELRRSLRINERKETGRTWQWKHEARRRAEREEGSSSRTTANRDGEHDQSSTRRHLDFH